MAAPAWERWILMFLLSVYTIRTVLGGGYIATWGRPRSDKKSNRVPSREQVYDCLNSCDKDKNCFCVRMNTRSASCDHMDPFPYNKESFDRKNYVYYAPNKYRFTLLNESGNAINYAFKKKASQSSIYELYGIQYTPDKAVDGSHNTDGLKSPYFAHTADGVLDADGTPVPNEVNPWWQVDLGKDIVVTGIRIRNRKEWADRLHDFDVRVGPKPISKQFNNEVFLDNARCYYHQGAGIKDEELLFVPCEPCPIKGRYVTIQIKEICTEGCRETDKNVLQLAEVEVFGFT